MTFRKDFLWGGGTSAAQYEGGWDEGGKSPVEVDFASVADNHGMRRIYFKTKEGVIDSTHMYGLIPEGAQYILQEGIHYTNHKATDFYHRYKEDIALFAQMGFKAFNLSISWARIFPHGVEGGVNKEGVEFYRNVFLELKKYNIEPIVTLWKYDMPTYYNTKFGGWMNRQLIDEFVEFAKVCFIEYKGLVKYWVTFNEINILIILAQMHGDNYQQSYQQLHHQFVAAAKAVKLAHEIDEDYKVGCMIAIGVSQYPKTCDPLDVLGNQSDLQEKFYYSCDTMIRGEYPFFSKTLWKKRGVKLDIRDGDLEILKEGKSDYIAFSYYSSSVFTTHDKDKEITGNLSMGADNPYVEKSDWGWSMDPAGLKYTLEELYGRYQMPLLIIENGLGAYDTVEDGYVIHDSYRIDYLKNHIKYMKEAVEDGVNLFGYTTWGCIDLVAASTGQVSKRYGFIYVDVDDEGNGTYDRYKKDSFYWYKKVIESNGEDLE